VALQGRGLLGHAGAHDEHLCAAVLQHVADLSRQEAVVEWHEHGSEPLLGEHRLERGDVVEAQVGPVVT
jgi:hypothetical protein